MSDANQIFILSLLITLTGFFMRKLGVVQSSDGKALSRIVLNFTFPALILSKVRTMPLDASLLYLPLICFCFCIILFITASFVFKEKPAREKGLLMLSMSGFNIGLFAFPIIEGIWGAKGLQYIAMFDLGNAFIVLGVGYFLGDYFSPFRKGDAPVNLRYMLGLFFKSLPFIAYLLALTLNYFSVGIPPLADSFFDTIAQANQPLVLFLLGVYFNLKIDKSRVIQISKVVLIRYGYGLLLGLVFYYFLPFDQFYRTIILIGLTLPIGLTIIPFSDKFGYDTEFSASLANISIVISFIIMWLIVGFTS